MDKLNEVLHYTDYQKLSEDLEHYSSLTYHPDLMARVAKAVKYMHEFEKTGIMSSRKLATIKNVVRSCKVDRMVAYNTSPESEAYWCS